MQRRIVTESNNEIENFLCRTCKSLRCSHEFSFLFVIENNFTVVQKMQNECILFFDVRNRNYFVPVVNRFCVVIFILVTLFDTISIYSQEKSTISSLGIYANHAPLFMLDFLSKISISLHILILLRLYLLPQVSTEK